MLKRLTLNCFYPIAIPLIILKNNPLPTMSGRDYFTTHQKFPVNTKNSIDRLTVILSSFYHKSSSLFRLLIQALSKHHFFQVLNNNGSRHYCSIQTGRLSSNWNNYFSGWLGAQAVIGAN